MVKYIQIYSGKVLFLTVLPILLFIMAYFFKEAGGPYYLNYYDPGYVYLTNSINILSFEEIGHTDHPGTSLQLFGAVVLKFIFSGKPVIQIIDEAFSNPEFYLNVLNKLLVTGNCIALLFLGVYVFRKTSNLYLSLLLQLTPFISFEIYYGLVIVSPENLLILSVLCLTAVLIYYVYSENSESHLTALSLVFALICGFGSVSKLNFIPVCILPLIVLKGLKNKLIYTGAAVVVFTLIFLPALSNSDKFTDWVANLIFNSGIHGKTDLSKFNPVQLLNNILTIFSKDIFLLIVFILILSGLIFSRFVKKVNLSFQNQIIYRKERRVLIAILLTITFQILVVAKNYLPYAQYYIVPSLMLAVPGLVFLFSYSIKTFQFLKRFDNKIIYITAIILVAVFSAYEAFSSFNEAAFSRDEAYKINKIIKEYPDSETVIPSVGTANEDCALALCTMYGYSGKMNPVYKNIFSKKVKSQIYHNFWENKLFAISDSTDIKKNISGRKKIVVQLMSVTSAEKFTDILKRDFNIETGEKRLIFKNGNQETVYEIFLK